MAVRKKFPLCETSFGSERWAYDAWLIQAQENPERMLVVEYARAKKDAQRDIEKIEKAVRGIQMRP